MKNFFSASAFLALYLFTGMNMYAQEKLFTLEDLNYGGSNYRNMVPENRYYTWWGDRLVRTDAESCATIDSKTGKETQLFTLDELNRLLDFDSPQRMRHLYNVEFPYPGEPIARLTGGKQVVLLNWKTGSKEAIYSTADMSAEDWCASSGNMAFVREHNLYITDKSGKTMQVTMDGSRELVYGQSVHRDEFGITKGTFWSPDGKRLAFYRMDQSMVTDYPQVDIVPRIAECQPDKYPMAGETSHKVTVGVYDTENGKTIYLQAGDPTDRYFTNIAWSPDNSSIYMFELNRDQNDCQLVCYDATTGKKNGIIYTEKHEKYVEPLHPIVFLPWNSTRFILQSRKDGYNHLYLYDTEGKELRQVTKGSWEVKDFVGFNEKNHTVIVTGNPVSPIQQNTFAVDLKTGAMKALDNGRGVHSASLSTSGQWMLDRFSEPDVPRKICLTGTAKANSTELFSAPDPWKEYKSPIFSCGTIKAADGQTDLYYRMVKPHDFDPTKKYPAVIYVYGGPHAHNVEASWHYWSRGWETYMAQKGYVLFIMDNRGSELRGREFEQATFRQLGQVEMQDQMKGVEFLKSQPYIDGDKLGVHGWSYGGFMTISLMTNYPDVFKVGVAGGPVIDWKWYEVMYGERYMDTPQSNPEGYARTSLLNKAKDLKGRLQIITGYNDATVVPQHCLSFLSACIAAGTQPDFFVYPGEPHNMRGHQSVHLHERITRYFEDYLK
ncbi:MAG: DPP IV N-terminal domain-containing protein [Prevotella sp.]